ncbi:IclR family transcriptional regulator [Sedimentitalea nanhaiensis]|uniref:Transcriptional regulator, IclR family n=1 Tax=Sedimentitalea nanhaiensis TaxID=999627 RepID=A0A1I7E5Q5_9RHOB|nr:IclR family transcriptional regulator [Sedimentitalea nanhaiensis]SFU19268.1 transcriptional regulator, IclR family [Sedimentitalea nanhaiensis]
MQERLIHLLEAIAGASAPVSVRDLMEITGLPKATIYRNVASLVDCGFLDETDGGSRYVLGMRFVRIALTGKADSHVIRAVAAMIQKTVNDLGETAFFSRYRGGRVDIVAVETPSDPAVSHIYPGLGPRPVHACSSAKAIAAFLAPDLREELMDVAPIRFTAKTVTDLGLLEKELSQVRRYGFAVCEGEIDEGVTSVAVPVKVDRLGSVFSIGVVGPSSRITPQIQNRILPVLTAQAQRASAAVQQCSVLETAPVYPEPEIWRDRQPS